MATSKRITSLLGVVIFAGACSSAEHRQPVGLSLGVMSSSQTVGVELPLHKNTSLVAAKSIASEESYGWSSDTGAWRLEGEKFSTIGLRQYLDSSKRFSPFAGIGYIDYDGENYYSYQGDYANSMTYELGAAYYLSEQFRLDFNILFFLEEASHSSTEHLVGLSLGFWF